MRFKASPTARADRLLASQPGMIRIDSNENPNGPGQHVFDAITRHLTDSNRYPIKTEDDLIAVIAKTPRHQAGERRARLRIG